MKRSIGRTLSRRSLHGIQNHPIQAEHIGFDRLLVGPDDLGFEHMLAGRQQEIHAERDRKLEEARKQRQIRRRQIA